MRNAYILLHTIKHMKTRDETQIPITFEANRIVIIRNESGKKIHFMHIMGISKE